VFCYKNDKRFQYYRLLNSFLSKKLIEMEKYEKIKRKDFLRDVGIEREDFVIILLEVEEYIEDLLRREPIKSRGRKAIFSLPNRVLLCFFIYAIILLFPS